MADLVFIVSRNEPKRYLYLKHECADENSDVVLDRRAGERRRSQRPLPTERRHMQRRHRDVTWELLSSGWAVARRGGNPRRGGHPMPPDAARCVESGCQKEGVVGLNGAWLCLTHFDIRFAARKALLAPASSARLLNPLLRIRSPASRLGRRSLEIRAPTRTSRP
jgi:hypothetical protein